MAQQRNFWTAVICGAAILSIGIGARQSFGIFQKPIAAELDVGRELWSFGNAFSMLLMGVLSPFVGNLADRFGTARTVAAGGALYVAGMIMMAMATEGVMLTVGNALSGIGMAAAGFGPILGAIGRQTPVEWRSSALGIATAGGSFGQFAIVPIASILQNSLDNWHSTLFVLAALSVMMVPLAVGLREDRAAPARAAAALRPQSSKDALQEAFRTQGFWLLTIGFFVCGFHVTFIGLHLPAYISDNSVDLSFLDIQYPPLRSADGRSALSACSTLSDRCCGDGLVGTICARICWRCFMRCVLWHLCCFWLCHCLGYPCSCLPHRSASSGSERFR